MRAIELPAERSSHIASGRSPTWPELDREFAAVILSWTASGGHSDRATAVALRRRVEALCASCVDVAIVSDVEPGVVDDRLRARPKGPGRLLVAAAASGELHEITETGSALMRPRAGSDADHSAMTAILDELAAAGVGPGLVLVVGGDFGGTGSDAHLLVAAATRAVVLSVGVEPAGVPGGVRVLGGGPLALRAVLDAVLTRRSQGRVPSVDDDPAWVLSESSESVDRRRVSESLLTLASGGIGTRGSVEEPARGSRPRTVAAGTYTGTGSEQHLLPGAGWTTLHLAPPPAGDVRQLDLRTGVLLRTEQGEDEVPLRTARLASHATPGLMLMRAECAPNRMTPGPALVARDTMLEQRGHRLQWRSTARGAGANIHALATQHERRGRTVHVLDRLAVYTANSQQEAGLLPERLLDAADRLGFDQLLAEHRAAWARHWDAVDIRIPADAEAQLAGRYALFQLRSHAGRHDELAVGARGLTGQGYSGHVFWDADVFVLPALATIDPAAARAMVRYRYERLGAARKSAERAGRSGARFPWESAADGDDVTPASGRRGGRVIPVRTGELAEHITADVAWAAVFSAEWEGRALPAGSPEAELLTETARYWAHRCGRDGAGRAHIDHVIGPDEYHEDVADNAFTNVMARWNLRAAARLCGGPDADDWLDLAAALVDGYDAGTGRYEQFAGYFGLEPLLVRDFATAPVAADVLLGPDRLAATQVIKQADVLMLHHLIPEETAPGSLGANLDFYGPRTAHGSSLSPAITATLLARAGRADEALDLLRIAMKLDLEDRNGNTGAGLHLATLSGVWQALLFGFAGARVRGTTLNLDPQLPAAWPEMEIRFLALGRHVRLRVDGDQAGVWSDGPLRVRMAGDRVVDLPGGTEFRSPIGRRDAG